MEAGNVATETLYILPNNPECSLDDTPSESLGIPI